MLHRPVEVALEEIRVVREARRVGHVLDHDLIRRGVGQRRVEVEGVVDDAVTAAPLRAGVRAGNEVGGVAWVDGVSPGACAGE